MEPFNLGKFLKSFTELLPWIKTLRYTIGAALILGVALFVYLKFSKPAQNIQVGQGGQVVIHNANKKAFIPFIEGGVEKNNNTKFETYMRGGVRVEF